MKLKIIRIVFSIIIFILFCVIFFISDKISNTFENILTGFQFIPSLLRLIFTGFSFLSTGFIIIILLTLLFGRVYCSFLCPLGILQDFIIFLSKLFKKKFNYMKPYFLIRYSILFITIIVSIIGSLAILNLIDPYAIFGRIQTNLIKPLSINLLNQITYLFKSFKIYINLNFMNHKIDIMVLVLSLLMFSVVGVMALFKGRMYCNIICPVGAILGIFSKYSLFNISINNEKCRSCMVCEHLCKAGCIDVKNKFVDDSRCISCYNCLDVCSFDAIKFKPGIKFNLTSIDWTKRNAVRNFLGIFIGLIGLASFPLRIFSKEKILDTAINKNRLISPPGSMSIKNMTDLCVSCHLCVSACPTKVITPSLIGYGLTGILQPKMDYNVSFCDYECNICTKVCPTGAIRPLTNQVKKTTKIGDVSLKKEYCIVYTKDQSCGACAEICPTTAVYMVPFKKNLTSPETDVEACIGCGACEYACPVKQPVKAISVDGLITHKTAIIRNHKLKENIMQKEQNKEKKIDNNFDKTNNNDNITNDDFPF